MFFLTFQSYYSLSKLQEHKRAHRDHRCYSCRKCRVSFLQKIHLKRHRCRPHIQGKHKCHVCSATFQKILSLANHICKKHPQVVKAQHLLLRNRWKSRQNSYKSNKPNIENTDDSKILLKISLGKSMTIISPSKRSLIASESNKKLAKRKSKRKHKKDSEKHGRKGIILSIKKGMVNVKDKVTDNSAARQKLLEKSPGQASTEYKVEEQKSELKLTIKACPDLGINTGKAETYKVLERSDSKSSLKLEKRSSSRTDVDKLDGREMDDFKPIDSPESKVRNGIVITKDKSGKLLAEQLPAVKSKRRDNVFESFNDVGIWKVLASPRDKPNDILKLKLSPHKPPKIESTLDDACEYNAAKYLDIPVDSVKVKGEASEEDSDVLELLPPFDKESDGNINNVNDSGIEVLSSSSCNRSNGNSVRSVVNEDNSPTYFNTEDSMFSLDSPLTEVVNRSEHSICHKCGSIIMEANNNAQSPGKCRCNTSDQSYSEMLQSPVKTNLVSPELKNNGDAVSPKCADIKQEKLKDTQFSVSTEHTVVASSPESEKSDSEGSDVMIITFDKDKSSSTEEGRSRLRLKLRSKDLPKSPLKGVTNSPQKKKRGTSVSPYKHENESAKCRNDKFPCSKFITGNEQSQITEANTSNNDQNNASEFAASSPKQNGKSQVVESANSSMNKEDTIPSVVVLNEDDNMSSSEKIALNITQTEIKDSDKQIRKKPLFRSKKSVNKEVTNSLSPSQLSDQSESKEKPCPPKEDKTVNNKKPLFKKRNLSADGNTESRAKKPCFTTQISLPANSYSDNENELAKNESKQMPGNEKLKDGENAACTKTVSKLCTVGPEDDDSLQDFSGEIDDGNEKNSNPLEQTKTSAVSFDLYQQQFLSFLSNTINSSKKGKSKGSEREQDKKQEVNGTERVVNNNSICKPCSETNDKKKSVPALPEKTADENVGVKHEISSKRNQTEVKTVKNKKIKPKTGRSNRQLNRNKDEKVVEMKNKLDESGKNQGELKVDNKPKPVLKRNRANSELEGAELEIKKMNAGELCQEESNTQRKIDSDSGLNQSKSTTSTTSKSVSGNETECNLNETAAAMSGESEKNDSIESNENARTVGKSDSLSWLSIFGGKSTINSNKTNIRESAADVMSDLSVNLAEINKKIDVSEDDDTNSLDVDDVFEVGNLSSLEPKHEINFSMSKITKESVQSEQRTGPPYKRKQTAKRTGGKFKAAKRKLESESECSEESSEAETLDMLSSHPDSDPDFNPFKDSDDDDFVRAPPKRHGPRSCVRSKKRVVTVSENSDSDKESKCSETDRLDLESQSSRSRRTKMGRKSSCPCCIGSPRKRYRQFSGDQDTSARKEMYRLPRKHKQFVRNTLRLLQLQEKIHTLFLTLFPECAEMITKSNIGTEEFESLINDVLFGVEEKEMVFGSAVHSVNYMDKTFDQSQFGSCPTNNIEMPFTAPGSATRTSEIDLVSGEDNNCTSVHVQSSEHKSHNDLNTVTLHSVEGNLYDENTAGKEIDTGISWQQSTPLSQSSLIASAQSHSSLKFENNTITDKDEPMEENVYESLVSYPSIVSESSLTFPQESVVTSMNAHYSGENNIDPVTHLSLLDHSGSVNSMGYFPPEVSSLPVVQSEITITLDLNALRVSLCRSPKSCLKKLQNQIIKLSKLFLPKLEFKNYFYKNIDNLEFLLDLMIEANSDGKAVNRDSENELGEEESCSEKWHIPAHDIGIIEAPIIMEDDTVQVNFLSRESGSKSEERESLFVKCSDLFEQEIKSQRESLKKDVFCIEDDQAEDTWKSAEKVLSSLNSLKKMAKRTEIAQRTRRPREARLRKRSADEKRTLFVREKIQNSQNSTIVCNTRTRSGKKGRVAKKGPKPENPKKRFLSELNLGDKLVTDNQDNNELLENCSGKLNGHVGEVEDENKVNEKMSSKTSSVKYGSNAACKVEKIGLADKSKVNNVDEVMGDVDFLLKPGDKNIFELMQPS